MNLLGLSQLGKASPNTPILPTSTSSFHRSKERYLLNRQRRLLMRNPPAKPDDDEIITPRHLFCMVLDRNLNVKWIEHRYVESSDSVCVLKRAQPRTVFPLLIGLRLSHLRSVVFFIV